MKNKLTKLQLECLKLGSPKHALLAKERREKAILEYNKNPKRCLYCNKPIEFSRRIHAKFCNSSCAAKYNNHNRVVTEAQKEKISKTLKSKPIREVKCCRCSNITYTNSSGTNVLCNNCHKSNIPYRKKIPQVCICQHCNKSFINPPGSKCKYCSEQCRKVAASKKLKLRAEERIKAGLHKGWAVRPIESYPERFFKQVLSGNGITYKFNYYISKRDLGLYENSGYFLDFLINDNIDLEIDGKQHKYPDRQLSDKKRDEILTKNNFIVYRIAWNEINSDEGKQLMKEKINKFLQWYNKQLNL